VHNTEKETESIVNTIAIKKDVIQTAIFTKMIAKVTANVAML